MFRIGMLTSGGDCQALNSHAGVVKDFVQNETMWKFMDFRMDTKDLFIRLELGYIPYGIPRAGNRTVEYSYCDYAIATVCQRSGKRGSLPTLPETIRKLEESLA